MTFRRIAGFLVVMFAVFSWPAMADTFTEGHFCTQPVKPGEFDADQEVAMFNDAVAAYKQCISAFADEHNRAADAHRSAASEAIDEWNTFIDENGLN